MTALSTQGRRARPADYATGWLAWAGAWLVGLLPLDLASAIGGLLGRSLGPLLPVHRVARRNLARAIPDLPPAGRRRILRDMWDNLGRTAFEYPHLAAFRLDGAAPRIEVVGQEHLRLGAGGPMPIFFSGHYGNWEVLALAANQLGLPVVQVYRGANNPVADRLLRRLRRPAGGLQLPKGSRSVRSLLKAMAEGAPLAVLIDQKMNDGIAAPFFGRDAMTAPMPAEFALRFGRPLLPVFCERRKGARFRVTIEGPLPVQGDARDPAAVRQVLERMNRRLEERIRDLPGHWFWVHRRWPD